MSTLTSPVVTFAYQRWWEPQKSRYLAIVNLCSQLDSLLDQLAALSPGAPSATQLIATGFALRDKIAYEAGPQAQFDFDSWRLLHQESLRLTGQGCPPNYSPVW